MKKYVYVYFYHKWIVNFASLYILWLKKYDAHKFIIRSSFVRKTSTMDTSCGQSILLLNLPKYEVVCIKSLWNVDKTLSEPG
jgi:hypothetical protein